MTTPRRVVAIGYSAGGLSPCLTLLEQLPTDSPDAYVVLPHLGRLHKSDLVGILGRHVRPRVCPMHHRQVLRPGVIYVLPQQSWAELTGLSLCLIPRPLHHLNCSITVFLSSLARQLGSRAVGVILSGAGVGAEGKGIRHVKRAGGLTFAQDPAGAQFADMPNQALATGAVDFRLSPTEIGRRLARL